MRPGALRLRILRALSLSVCIGRASVGVVSGADVTLENNEVRIVVREGALLSMFDKARSFEHAAPVSGGASAIFSIRLVEGVRPADDILSTSMEAGIVRVSSESAEIRYDHPRVSASVGIRLEGGEGGSVWRMSVTPKGESHAVGAVAYPLIATPRAVGGDDKHVLFPMFEGRFPPLSRPPRWRAYPSDLFAQMIACVSADGGFLLWTDDPAGHVKAFGVSNRTAASIFGVRHQMPYSPGRPWTAPYETRLAFCGGAWQDAADIYRVWSNRQPWSATPLRERVDVPAVLHAPPLCISTQIDKEELDSLPGRLAAWGERFGAPVVYRPLGWEKHGNWVGIDYLPPSTGEDRFRNLAARLGDRNIALAGFISGYRWTTRSRSLTEPRNGELAAFFDRLRGADVCERGRDGELVSFQAEGRDSHRICRGTAFGRTFLQDAARSLFDLGVTVIHDDQDHGPYPDGVESCFDASHGHPVPCGPWAAEATRASFRAIRDEAARRGVPNFFLTKESCTELFNMELHAYQARYFHESSVPDLVPLCQYLYHEHIPTVFGWATANSRSPREIAAMIVYGQIPSLSFWNASCDGPESMAVESGAILEDYYAAMRAHARPYLLHGRMRRPMATGAPFERRTISRIKTRILPQPVRLNVPLVLQSAWDDGRGNVGVFAVNLTGEIKRLMAPAPGPGRWRVSMYTGAMMVGQRRVDAGAALEWSPAPYRLCSIVFEPEDGMTAVRRNGEPMQRRPT